MTNPLHKKIITVQGFMFSGTSAGIKKTTHKPDLALIFSETAATIAGVFTTNYIKAAPVIVDISRIRKKQKGQAVIINSGNANACTGQQGLKDAKEMVALTARELNIPSELVYVSSTGIIGKPLPMKKIRKAIPRAVKNLSPLTLEEAATAITTTDAFIKVASKKIRLGGKEGTIAAIAKGAGMICPNMATMLCFIVTDIAVEHQALASSLTAAVSTSFNRLTVDNDMSTNDTVLIMANGLAGNKPITKKSSLYNKFRTALSDVTYSLSKMIALDGEGATKIIEVTVRGARTESDAEKIARTISSSLLVKTAMYGKSLNWGRIMASTGCAGVKMKEEKINIYINNLHLVRNGTGIGLKKGYKNPLSGKEVNITVDLGLGKKEATVLTCDLTEKYIKINAHYIT
jgi:glutamate N-acetyltransferase/amino-acid N-acetyltransferase